MQHDPTRLLRSALRANATFSAVCGSILLLGAFRLDEALGIPMWVLLTVGVALLPFAAQLRSTARRVEIPRRDAWIVVALDGAWVLGSAALILLDLWPLTSAGRWAVIGVADFVLLWAVLQALGLVRASGAGRGSTRCRA